jgi:hypothetical protein
VGVDAQRVYGKAEEMAKDFRDAHPAQEISSVAWVSIKTFQILLKKKGELQIGFTRFWWKVRSTVYHFGTRISKLVHSFANGTSHFFKLLCHFKLQKFLTAEAAICGQQLLTVLYFISKSNQILVVIAL